MDCYYIRKCKIKSFNNFVEINGFGWYISYSLVRRKKLYYNLSRERLIERIINFNRGLE